MHIVIQNVIQVLLYLTKKPRELRIEIELPAQNPAFLRGARNEP